MPRTTKESSKQDKKIAETGKKSTTNKKTTAAKKESSKTKTVNKTTNTKSKSVTSSSTKEAKKTSAKASKTTSTTKAKTSKNKEPIYILEYYDLPYRYNQTVVRVLAQTPTTLFVYWDISDEDRAKYQSQYGDNFFETTKPVLVIHNETMNYTYEVEINDFANSWYLHINDPDCKYHMELGRRPKFKNNHEYISITTSNSMDAPNNHVLYNTAETVTYSNVKTKERFNKKIATFLPSMSKIYNVSNLYKILYPNEWKSINQADINNPSSGGISSFK